MPDTTTAAPEATPNLDTIFAGGGSAAPEAGTQPEATPTQAPAATPTSAAPAPTINAGLLARAQSAGLTLDGLNSDSDLATFLLDRYTSERPYADLGRQYLTQPPPRSEPEPPAAAPEDAFDLDKHFSDRWNVPKFEDSWKRAIDNGLVQIDPETGLYAPAPGREALGLPIVAGLNQAHLAQREQLQSLFNGNPYRQMYDALLEPLKQALSQDFQQLSQQSVQQLEQQQFVQSFEQQNSSWLYQNGQLTPLGQKFNQNVAQLEQQGVTDARFLLETAKLMSGVPAQSAAPAAPQPTKQEAFLERSRRLAAASTPSSAPAQSTPDAPVTMKQSDLDNIFMATHRQRMAAA